MHLLSTTEMRDTNIGFTLRWSSVRPISDKPECIWQCPQPELYLFSHGCNSFYLKLLWIHLFSTTEMRDTDVEFIVYARAKQWLIRKWQTWVYLGMPPSVTWIFSVSLQAQLFLAQAFMAYFQQFVPPFEFKRTTIGQAPTSFHSSPRDISD